MESKLHVVAADLDIDLETEVLPNGRIYLLAQADGTSEVFSRLVEAPSDELGQRQVLGRIKAELVEYTNLAATR